MALPPPPPPPPPNPQPPNPQPLPLRPAPPAPELQNVHFPESSPALAPPPAVGIGAEPAAAATVPTVPEGPKIRDRIVVLGRTRSGKTVFIARLYHLLFRAKGDLRMEACSGVTHTAIVKFWQELADCKWPAATTATDSHTFDLKFRSSSFTMVVSDYPGEVFRKAFMEDTTGADERALIDSIDRAQAIIFLVDPLVMIGTNLLEGSEQGFGLAQAIKRLRTTPGGEDVPIALVVTKYDLVREEVKAAGGVKGFLCHHYPTLVDTARGRGTMAYTCIAVRSRPGALGKERPDWDAPARYVEDPLRACLEIVVTNANKAEHRAKIATMRRIQEEITEQEDNDAKKASVLSIWVVSMCFLVLALVVVGGIWWIRRGGGAS